MDKLPTDKSCYIHTLIFGKGTGLNNIWGYFPDEMALVGYIQYSFLQEAFYMWINCKNGPVSYIPIKPVEVVIKDGENEGKITKAEADEMRKTVMAINKFWSLPKNKVMIELKKFSREFNRKWYGDNQEFLYLKVFNKPEELGDFVVQSSYMASTDEEFKNIIGKNIEGWKEICTKSIKNKEYGELFRDILQKNLTEVI